MIFFKFSFLVTAKFLAAMLDSKKRKTTFLCFFLLSCPLLDELTKAYREPSGAVMNKFLEKVFKREIARDG